MAIFNIKSIAFKWYYVTRAGAAAFLELFHIFVKQLGLGSHQIGMTGLFGLHLVFVPILFLVADWYRVRILLTWIVSSLLVISCLLPLLPVVVSLPSCLTQD